MEDPPNFKVVIEHTEDLGATESSTRSDLRLESISSLYLSIPSLKSMESENNNIIQNLRVPKRKKICQPIEYILVSLVSSICAATVVFVWYHSRNDEKPQLFVGRDLDQPMQELSNYSCPFWHITGDEYCDDEANIEQCGYDFKDCCTMQNDRTLCQDCFCHLPQQDKIKIEEKFKKCDHPVRDHWGNGYCDLNHNNAENFFDVGDCCLENLQCRLKFENFTNFIPRFCPENTCIQSNIFCILEELGDGICQDHNNGPFCDYDLGDCCLTEVLDDHVGTFTMARPKINTECCDCFCKANFDPLNPFLLGATIIPQFPNLG